MTNTEPLDLRTMTREQLILTIWGQRDFALGAERRAAVATLDTAAALQLAKLATEREVEAKNRSAELLVRNEELVAATDELQAHIGRLQEQLAAEERLAAQAALQTATVPPAPLKPSLRRTARRVIRARVRRL